LKRKELIALILGRPFHVVAMSRADCSLNEIMRIKDLMKLFYFDNMPAYLACFALGKKLTWNQR
jgi:hypothetical protein